MKVAVVHYWLVTYRGGERVLDSILALYPGADIYTHVISPELEKDFEARGHRVFKTFIHRLPRARHNYRNYLPLMPLALEQLDLRGYDLVISSESGPSKGVIVPPGTQHICYCHTPMRYVWDMYHDYMTTAGRLKRFLMRPLIHYLRVWDRLSADGVDHFIANSYFVAQRVQRYYRRNATVIHPPVSTDAFAISEELDDYYLMVGQLVAYKRVEIAVEAFNQLGLPLVIIGEGEQLQALQRRAGPTVRFLGRQSDAVIREYYQRCQALIFPGVEDFGIVPLEAMASGRPVIAFGQGGACETVLDGVTGLFFHEQTPASLIDAVQRFQAAPHALRPPIIRAHAMNFDRLAFQYKLKAEIDQMLKATNVNGAYDAEPSAIVPMEKSSVRR